MVFLPFLPKKIPFLFLLIFLSLIFSNSTLYSQVKIKERVGIKPEVTKTIMKNESLAQSGHIVKVQITMSSNVFCYRWFDWWEQVYKIECGIGTGTASITPPGSAGSVTVQGGEATFYQSGTYYWAISWANPNGGPSCHQDAEIKVFLDGNLIYSFSVTDACSAYGPFTVVFPKCEPECTSPPPLLTFTSKDKPNSFGGHDWCSIAQRLAKERSPNAYSTAIFSPVTNKIDFYQQPQLTKCYNNTGGYWQFTINPIELNVILTSCPQNIPFNGKEIYNDSPLCQFSRQELLYILEDLKEKFKYSGANHHGYIFVDLDLDHERVHKKDYENLINDYFPKIQNVVNRYKPKCDETGVEEKIKKRITDNLEKMFNDVQNKWIKRDRKEYEEKTQGKLYAKIDSLITFINDCPNMRQK